MQNINEKLSDIKKLSEIIGRQNKIDTDDLYQEGCLGYLCYGNMKACIGQMKEFCRKERAANKIKDIGHIYHGLDKISRTFEGLDDYISQLESKQQVVIKLWLENLSLSEIGRRIGSHNKTVKNLLTKSFLKISEFCGEDDLNFECVFPILNRELPPGIRERDGKFIAYSGHSGSNYIGTFSTVEEAIKARKK